MSTNPLDQIPVGELMDRVKAVAKQEECSLDTATLVVMCEIYAEAEKKQEDSLQELDLTPIWAQLGIGPFPEKLPQGALAKR